MRGRSTDLRESRIARQIEVVLAQEEALDKRRTELREREDRLLERERELEKRRKALEFEWSKRTAALDEREAILAAKEKDVGDKAVRLEETARKKARSLAQETVELAERNREIAWREKAVKAVLPDPAEVDDTQEIVLEAAPPAGGWNLNRIERLVEANAGASPERVSEWRYYLLYLREFAEIGGALPSSFDRLVWDAFGDLLAADAIAV